MTECRSVVRRRRPHSSLLIEEWPDCPAVGLFHAHSRRNQRLTPPNSPCRRLPNAPMLEHYPVRSGGVMERPCTQTHRRSSTSAIRIVLACAVVLSCLQPAHADASAVAGTWKGSYQCPLPTHLTLIIRSTGPREVEADFVFQAQGTPKRLPPGDFPMKGTYDPSRKRLLLIPGPPRTIPPGFRTLRGACTANSTPRRA